MDSFDLRWPKTNATLLTDGQRLRIVVRDKRGPSGTILNNELCKKRIAVGLSFAPTLLDELKARGYRMLADELEVRAGQPSERAQPVSDPVDDWLEKLTGDRSWEDSTTKRAKTWHPLSDDLALKVPTKRGAKEWAVKDTSEKKASYICTPDFAGVCHYLRARWQEAGHDDQSALITEVLSRVSDLAGEHAAIEEAIRTWQKH